MSVVCTRLCQNNGYTVICPIVRPLTNSGLISTGVNAKKANARAVMDLCRNTIEKVNESDNLKKLFGDSMLEEYGNEYRLNNSPQHCWTSICDVLERLIQLHPQLEAAYAGGKQTYPLTEELQVMKEFHAVIAAIKIVQKVSQKTQSFAALECFVYEQD